MCYSFNFVGKSGSPSPIMLSGEPYGLNMILDTEIYHNAMQGLTESEGVKVVVHDPAHYPMTTTSGVYVPTGTDTKVSLRMGEIVRESDPYVSNCTSVWVNSTFAEK